MHGWIKNMKCKSCGKDCRSSSSNACLSEGHISYYVKWRVKFLSRPALRERAILKLCGGTLKCVSCPEQDIRVLSVNHLLGSPKLPKQRELMQAILRDAVDTSKYDVRCANCQIRYEYEIGRMSLMSEKARPLVGLL